MEYFGSDPATPAEYCIERVRPEMIYYTVLMKHLEHLKGKGHRYWITVFALIILGLFLGHWFEAKHMWTKIRYGLYGALQDLNPRPPEPERTTLVLIGDKEYWKGELARRVPIRKDYLAKLLLILDSVDPTLIAFDFDFRSPVVHDNSLIEHPAYCIETKQFLDAIQAVSQRRPVILSATLSRNRENDLIREPAIYDNRNFSSGKVAKGYIELPYDKRRVPLSIKTQDGTSVDSFAVAIVRAEDEERAGRVNKEDSMPYGTFIPPSAFKTVAASDVLSKDPGALKKLRHRIVIVGGAWHRFAYERGSVIDTHDSPVGNIGGAFIHANYVEALLDRRTIPTWGEEIEIIVEMLLSLSVAVIFALQIQPKFKLYLVFSMSVLLILFAYVSFQNLGVFFDFFIPVLLLASHVGVEQIREWRALAKASTGGAG